MQKRTERISPELSGRAMKRFLPDREMRIGLDPAKLQLFTRVDAAPLTTFHQVSKSETIIARERESSVSHFIDCNPVALRLCGRCQ
jgi:hypothetical protein